MHRRFLWTIAIGLGLGCSNRGAESGVSGAADDSASSLRVLAPAPDPTGRHICRVDSISTKSSGQREIACDVGGDTGYTARNDTIIFLVRPVDAPAADPKLSMLDYWKLHLAPAWEKRMGGRPTRIDERRETNFDYFEAYWDRPNKTRELVAITRVTGSESSTERTIRWMTMDCRPLGDGKPIGCK
jgi:hypothetical protein